ncbi:MAG TPA: ribosome maturation factor RimM [Steroidobacteraceae bacterium]|nr:ribosome maturation factor RimM [Steroidobacteraceae bacterium]
MGRIIGPHGVRGALKVLSYAHPPQSLLQYRSWRLRRADGGEDEYRVLQSQWDGHLMRAQLEGVADRDAAQRLREREILIERDLMPAAGPGEYYREDLQGFTVRNLEGVVLGTLQYFLEAPAGALMVVSGERERWLPTTAPFLKRVDLERREIELDWPADF